MSTALGIEMKTAPLPIVEDKDLQRVADALVKCIGGHIHRVFEDAQFPLECHWANVSYAPPDVRGAI